MFTDPLRRILEDYGLPDFGIVPYAQLRDRLLPGAAARGLPPDIRAVAAVAAPYRWPGEERIRRNIARYAAVPDYHKRLGAVLETVCAALLSLYPQERFVPFVDHSPFPEVGLAAAAGLGVVGDHGLLITPRYGSYVFIAAIASSVPWESTAVPIGRCIQCGRCAAACPAACIGPGLSEKRRCVSAITQKKGPLSPQEEELLRQCGTVWGCDVCQEVCPHNAGAKAEPHPCFDVYRPFLEPGMLSETEGWAYGWRGTAVLRRNLMLWEKRNGAI